MYSEHHQQLLVCHSVSLNETRDIKATASTDLQQHADVLTQQQQQQQHPGRQHDLWRLYVLMTGPQSSVGMPTDEQH